MLEALLEKPVMEAADWSCLAYYLLLQDRISESIEIFGRVALEDLPGDGSLRIQFDYMAAYLDFFTG